MLKLAIVFSLILQLRPVFAFDRIVNGSPINLDDVPAQASLFRFSSFICGAVLLSSRTAITAGHCVYAFQYRPEYFQIRYGSADIKAQKSVDILRISLFPAYSVGTLDYDIAVLTLSDSVENIEFATLPEVQETRIPPNIPLIAVGWGKMEDQRLSLKLLMANLVTVSFEECRAKNTGWFVSERMFCAKGVNSSTTCHGDSGSGVYAQGLPPKPLSLVGLVSWGDTGCTPDNDTPSGFVDLTNQLLGRWLMLLII